MNMIDKALILGSLAAMVLSVSGATRAADSVEINDLVVAGPIANSQREATEKAVRAFYNFWDAGDEALLKQAIAPTFTDRTLPPGRPQGPEGPAFAAAAEGPRSEVRIRASRYERRCVMSMLDWNEYHK